MTLSKENCIDIYLPEVSLEYLADALMVDKDTLLLTSKEHLKFEDAIEQGNFNTTRYHIYISSHSLQDQLDYTFLLPIIPTKPIHNNVIIYPLKLTINLSLGYQLIQFHRHDPTNPNSHYVAQLLKNSRIKTFGNVSSTLIEQIYGDECLDSWITTEKEFLNVLEKYKPRGLDFETCVKIGGRIVKSSETSKGRVTVKFMIGDLVKG